MRVNWEARAEPLRKGSAGRPDPPGAVPGAAGAAPPLGTPCGRAPASQLKKRLRRDWRAARRGRSRPTPPAHGLHSAAPLRPPPRWRPSGCPEPARALRSAVTAAPSLGRAGRGGAGWGRTRLAGARPAEGSTDAHLRLPRQRLPRVEVTLARPAEGVAALPVVAEGPQVQLHRLRGQASRPGRRGAACAVGAGAGGREQVADARVAGG